MGDLVDTILDYCIRSILQYAAAVDNTRFIVDDLDSETTYTFAAWGRSSGMRGALFGDGF